MSLYQSFNFNELKQNQNIYKTYSYVVFGSQKVGKTNIITRFVKDQFTQAHNMTLEGQQSSVLNIDNTKFQVLVHDTAGQQNLCSMKAVWRGNKDGYIFVYSIDNYESFEHLLEEIQQVKDNQLYKKMPAIVVGNKLDLRNERKVDKQYAQGQMKRFNLKVVELSAKKSPRQQIVKIFGELVEMNEMNMFSQHYQEGPRIIKVQNGTKRLWQCCSSDQRSRCQLM